MTDQSLSTTVEPALNPWAAQRERMALEEAGKTVEWQYGWKFKIRRKGQWNKDFQGAGTLAFKRADFIAFRTRTSGRGYVQTEADTAYWRKIQMEIFIDGCLVGWENVVDQDGTPMQFTKANCMKVFGCFRDLYAFLNAATEDEATFEPEYVPSKEIVAGNS